MNINTISTFALGRIEVTTNPHGRQFPAGDSRALIAAHELSLVCARGTWRVDISLRNDRDRQLLAEAAAHGPVRCVIGDADEARAATAVPCANALVISLDLRHSTLALSTSLTGLPPLFVYRSDSGASLSSPFIPATARGSLQPDADGIADMLRWGHPLDGRTLFANLKAVAAYATVTVSADGSVGAVRPLQWPSLEDLSSLTREDIVREQMAAFSEAAGRIDARNAFMSLSGGLDSRTSLVGLLQHGHRVPCLTMGASLDNLDVRLAQAFCKAHGLQHHAVLLDDAFRLKAPTLLLKSAELTGGVSCLSQTADLFLYQSVSGSFAARISGNLGNQVGRGGVESLSAYQPRPEVFSAEVRQRLLARPVAPWFIPRLAAGDYGEILFGQEVPYWSLGNYVAGSSCALQLTPYADSRLMHLARAAFARDSELQPASWKTLRERDLQHRLVGTPKRLSFQRQFLVDNDLQGREIPLNWGWRAAGGRSFGWSLSAMVSAADAALIKMTRKAPALRPAARWLSTRLGRRSALVDWPSLIKTQLRELALDTFASREVRQAGVFDAAALDRMVRDHFNGVADHYQTLSRSLEIALGVSCRSRASA